MDRNITCILRVGFPISELLRRSFSSRSSFQVTLIALSALRKDNFITSFNPLNAELNPICHLLALLGAHHILHVSRIRVKVLLYLYRARNKITQLSVPTHAQRQRHRLKFIKNHVKNSYMFRSSTIFRELQRPR